MGLGVRFQVKRVGNQQVVDEIHKVVVHKFLLGDVDDPDIYAVQPIYEWQESDQGKFVMENAIGQPEFHRHMDMSHLGYRYAITAELEKKKLAEMYLRWGKIE